MTPCRPQQGPPSLSSQDNQRQRDPLVMRCAGVMCSLCCWSRLPKFLFLSFLAPALLKLGTVVVRPPVRLLASVKNLIQGLRYGPDTEELRSSVGEVITLSLIRGRSKAAQCFQLLCVPALDRAVATWEIPCGSLQ